jgi:hypothetical protein
MKIVSWNRNLFVFSILALVTFVLALSISFHFSIFNLTGTAVSVGRNCESSDKELINHGQNFRCARTVAIVCPSNPSKADQENGNIYCKETLGKLQWALNPKVTEQTSALSLAFAGCTSGNFSPDPGATVNFQPLSWEGNVIDHAKKNGTWPETKFQAFNLSSFLDSATYMETAFGSAASLDSRWNRLLETWNQSIVLADKSWDSGNGLFQASSAGMAYAPQLTGICTVAYKSVKDLALGQNRTFAEWVGRNGMDLLPVKQNGSFL